MKFVLLIICLFFVRVLPAQKPVTIECRIGEGIGKIMQLSGVNNGQQKYWQVLLMLRMVIMVFVLFRNMKVLCFG